VTTPIIFPDVELTVTGYLRTRLASYAGGPVRVSTAYKGGPLEVTVRRDGGPALDAVREVARLGVNVYATANNDQAVSNLARTVAALLSASADGNPILSARQTSGPSPIPEASGLTHRYLTFELIVRGSEL
jgi:hypothetical protein